MLNLICRTGTFPRDLPLRFYIHLQLYQYGCSHDLTHTSFLLSSMPAVSVRLTLPPLPLPRLPTIYQPEHHAMSQSLTGGTFYGSRQEEASFTDSCLNALTLRLLESLGVRHAMVGVLRALKANDPCAGGGCGLPVGV